MRQFDVPRAHDPGSELHRPSCWRTAKPATRFCCQAGHRSWKRAAITQEDNRVANTAFIGADWRLQRLWRVGTFGDGGGFKCLRRPAANRGPNSPLRCNIHGGHDWIDTGLVGNLAVLGADALGDGCCSHGASPSTCWPIIGQMRQSLVCIPSQVAGSGPTVKPQTWSQIDYTAWSTPLRRRIQRRSLWLRENLWLRLLAVRFLAGWWRPCCSIPSHPSRFASFSCDVSGVDCVSRTFWIKRDWKMLLRGAGSMQLQRREPTNRTDGPW